MFTVKKGSFVLIYLQWFLHWSKFPEISDAILFSFSYKIKSFAGTSGFSLK